MGRTSREQICYQFWAARRNRLESKTVVAVFGLWMYLMGRNLIFC